MLRGLMIRLSTSGKAYRCAFRVSFISLSLSLNAERCPTLFFFNLRQMSAAKWMHPTAHTLHCGESFMASSYISNRHQGWKKVTNARLRATSQLLD